MIFMKIAFRNVLQNKKRSLLIGLTLVISCTFLLLSYAIGNGIGKQILQRYKNFQSGDVSVVWKSVKEIDISDPSRLFYSEFKSKNDHENKEAIKRLNIFLTEHAKDIATVFKTVSNSGMLDTGRYASFSIIQGLTREELTFLRKNRIFELTAGDIPIDYECGICISDEVAQKYELELGDWVILDSDTAHGFTNTLDYQIVGLYRSSSEFDSIYVYMSQESALELFDQDAEYFKLTRIYLKDPSRADTFASELDDYLTKKSDLLRAESLNYSSQFFSTIAGFQKKLFSCFVIFLLFIIAIGIRSAVRINIFERMREFGTLRAMGFNRLQNFLIIFYETLLLSLLALGIAFLITLILVAILNQTGIHIGKGAIAYALGGEYIYPIYIFSDTLTALLIMLIFSLFAPLKPGLQLCNQKIFDMLGQNQKSVSILKALLKNTFLHKNLHKTTKNSRILTANSQK